MVFSPRLRRFKLDGRFKVYPMERCREIPSFECSLQWLWKPGLCAIYVYMAGLIRNLSSICSSRISVVCSQLRQWKYAQHYRFSQWYRVRYGRKRIQHLRYGLWTIRDGV